MNAAPTQPKSPSPLDTALSDSFGRISLENDETTYVSGDHWLAILDGVCNPCALVQLAKLTLTADCRVEASL